MLGNASGLEADFGKPCQAGPCTICRREQRQRGTRNSNLNWTKGWTGRAGVLRARGRNGWRGVGSAKPQNYIQRSHVCKVLGGPATKPSESNKLHPRSRSAVRPPGSRVSHSISLMECFSMASFGKGSGSPRQQFQHIAYGFLIFGNGVGLEEPPRAFTRPVEGLRWQSLCPPTNPANESICCLTRKFSPAHTLVEIVSGRG